MSNKRLLNLAYSRNRIIKYFWRYFQLRINEIRIRRNKVTQSTVHGEYKGNVSRKIERGFYTGIGKASYNCYFASLESTKCYLRI
jgi:hypothetical protein